MRIGILGGGIGGLASAYFLEGSGAEPRVFEASGIIGGLARSFRWHGFDCDIGPHRLYTDDTALLEEIKTLVPLNRLRRKSRIYIRGRWIRDPVNVLDLIVKFFPRVSIGIVLGYLGRKSYPPDHFEHVVLSRFGRGLNQLFFKPYSEKLFGIPADTISANWAQRKLRIGGWKDLVRKSSKLYFDYFHYPKSGGYGAISQGVYERVRERVQLNTPLTAIELLTGGKGYRCSFAVDGKTVTEEFDVIVSTLALPLLGRMLGTEINLRARPARFTYLLLGKPRASDYQWFYFADKDFIINRVSEYKNFGAAGLPEGKTVLCCEVTELDRFSVEEIIRELEVAGILKAGEVEDILTLDVPNAYPLYGLEYDSEIAKAATFFARHPRIFHVGRHAQFAHKDIDEVMGDAKEAARLIRARFSA